MKRISIACVYWAVVCCFCLLSVPLSSNAQTADDYRQTLIGFANLLEQTAAHSGRNDHLSAIELALDQLEQLPDDTLLGAFGQSMPLSDLQQLLTDLRGEMDRAVHEASATPDTRSTSTRSTTIEIPEVTVEPSFCEYATGTIAGIELLASKVLKQIFAATEFTCLQTIAGTNLAAACASVAVLSVTAELSYLNAEFCLAEQRAAKGETILDLDRNIGEFLNVYIDDTTASSRATQDSVNTLQGDITTNMASINTIQSELNTGFTTVEADLNDALDELTALNSALTDLIAEADDIQFRVQANQVDIEDVQTRTADLQESTEEVRTDTQSIISSVGGLQTTADSLLSSLDNGFEQINQDAIAAALSNAAFGVAEYALPEAAGGQLEDAREVLIQAILALDNLGLGNTTTALTLLAQGDQFYNQQDYVSAYNLFAQAYQSLAATVVIR